MNQVKQFLLTLPFIMAILSTPAESVAAAGSKCEPLTITPRILPTATAGKPYDEKIVAFGGVSPVKLLMTSGSVPSGMRLDSDAKLKGTPLSTGRFEFKVTAFDKCVPTEQTVSAVFAINVANPGEESSVVLTPIDAKLPLKLDVVPSPQKEKFVGGNVYKIRYKLASTPKDTATFDSAGASFVVNGSVVQSLAVPLTAILVNGEGEVEDQFTIPQRVLDYVKREPTKPKIIYNRAFTGRKTTAVGVVEFFVP